MNERVRWIEGLSELSTLMLHRSGSLRSRLSQEVRATHRSARRPGRRSIRAPAHAIRDTRSSLIAEKHCRERGVPLPQPSDLKVLRAVICQMPSKIHPNAQRSGFGSSFGAGQRQGRSDRSHAVLPPPNLRAPEGKQEAP